MERAGASRTAVAVKTVPGIRDAGNRRVLRDIKNLVGAPPDPIAIAKKPMLEKFAAPLGTKELPDHQATTTDAAVLGGDPQRKPNPDETIDTGLESCNSADIIDMDETESNNSDTDDSVMDIDSADSRNPLAATEYAEELYSFYRENEQMSCVRPDYMTSQGDINEKMRAILIDWLIEVHYRFELMDETLLLTVNIIDRFLEKQVVLRKKLQLVGVTAMLLACKYEEPSIPYVEDLVLISDRAYTKGQILEMEKLILNTLQFNMSTPTPYVFIRRFLKAADSDKQLELLSFFMLELCLVEYEMLKYRPSLLAAAAVYTAQCTLNRCHDWTNICELHSGYSGDQLIECSRMMVEFYQKAGAGKLTAVHRKYSTFKFGCAAKVEPALFLLESGGGTQPSAAIC